MDDYALIKYLQGKCKSENGHFDKESAEEIVSSMFHVEKGVKEEGEKYDCKKAKEVYEKYEKVLPEATSIEDVYVALNATWHDWAGLYKLWFGSSLDRRIIEAAIMFWFEDDDYGEECKLWKYFKG